MWKNIVEMDKPQMTLLRMRIACWIPKATDTNSEYVILTAFSLQQWLHERPSKLRYAYNGSLAFTETLVAFKTQKRTLWTECRSINLNIILCGVHSNHGDFKELTDNICIATSQTLSDM
jgi:hypothetical protein